LPPSAPPLRTCLRSSNAPTYHVTRGFTEWGENSYTRVKCNGKRQASYIYTVAHTAGLPVTQQQVSMAEIYVAHTAVTASAFAVAFFCSLTATLAEPLLAVVHVLFDGCRCCRSIIHISMLTTRASFEMPQEIQFLSLEDWYWRQHYEGIIRCDY
jgi:hypothetical protein